MSDFEPRELLSAYLDGELSVDERQLVDEALAADEGLGEELALLQEAQDDLGGLPSVQAPEGFVGSVLARVGDLPVPEVVEAGAPGDAPLPFLLRLLVPEKLPTFALSGVAALSVLCVGLFFVATHGSDRGVPPLPSRALPMDATASGGTPVATGGAFADREVVGGSAVEAADDAVVAVDLPSEELSEATLDALGVQPPQGAAAPSVGAPSASSRPRARKKSSGKGIQEVRGKAAEARDIYVAEFERAGEVDLAAAGVPIGELEDGDGVAMDLTFAPEDVGLDEAAVEAEMEADLGAGVVELAPSRSDLAPIGAARRSSGVLRRGSAPPAETKKAGRAAGALWSDTNLSTALARLRKDAETRGWSWAQQFSKSTAGALVQVSVPTDLLPEALDWIRSQGLVDGVQEVVSGADGKSTIRLTVLEPAK